MVFKATLIVLLTCYSVICLGISSYDKWEQLAAEVPPIPTPFKRVNITASDGITLEAIVFDSKNPKIKNPTIIFISSWGLNKYEYIVPAQHYSDLGYTVVSYTSRGFWGSSQRHNQPGGLINLAGEKDVADISSVIDWAIKNTNADVNRIGASGISYGGGLSLLGSAFDSRIRTVVAMSCWVDMAESLLGNGNTIKVEGAEILEYSALLLGSVGEDLQYLFDNYLASTKLDELRAMTVQSSPATFLAQIQANKPNIFIANAFGDSLFTPNQFPSFFEALTGNKHLEYSPGDHAGPEMSGLFPQRSNHTKIFGVHGLVWERAESWFEFYLKNNNTGVMSTLSPVIFNTITTNGTLDYYKNWGEVTNDRQKFALDSRETLNPVRLSPTSSEQLSAWRDVASITTGWGTISGGVALITNTAEAMLDTPRVWNLREVNRKYAAVFMTGHGDLGRKDLHIRGIPSISLKVVPAAAQGSVVVYLLDVAEYDDMAKLITFAPYTFAGAKPGKQLELSFDITMTSYNLLAGRRLAVLVGTKDRLFKDMNEANQDLIITDGCEVIMPFHI